MRVRVGVFFRELLSAEIAANEVVEGWGQGFGQRARFFFCQPGHAAQPPLATCERRQDVDPRRTSQCGRGLGSRGVDKKSAAA